MSSTIQRARVPLGFIYGILFLYLADPSPAVFYPGVGLAAVGLALRLWASGYLKKGRELAISGPYAWTRNPLYLGSLIMGIGFAVSSGDGWLMAVFPPLFAAVYWPVMRREEEELSRSFGAPFEAYRANVALFVPLPGGKAQPNKIGRHAKSGNFQWEKVIYNREYRAAVGFLLIAVLVWCKMLWF